MKKFLIGLLGIVLLTACGIGDTNTTYSRAEIGQQGSTSIGRIIAMTQIEIAGSTEGGTLVGAGIGGLAGGVAGSAVGKGKGKDLMAIAGTAVGVLAGAAAGGAAQQAATKDTAYEFLIQTGSSNNVISVVQTNELRLREGDQVVLVKMNGTTRIRYRYTGR